jgi:hypothetical protein
MNMNDQRERFYPGLGSITPMNRRQAVMINDVVIELSEIKAVGPVTTGMQDNPGPCFMVYLSGVAIPVRFGTCAKALAAYEELVNAVWPGQFDRDEWGAWVAGKSPA